MGEVLTINDCAIVIRDKLLVAELCHKRDRLKLLNGYLDKLSDWQRVYISTISS